VAARFLEGWVIDEATRKGIAFRPRLFSRLVSDVLRRFGLSGSLLRASTGRRAISLSEFLGEAMPDHKDDLTLFVVLLAVIGAVVILFAAIYAAVVLKSR
jgi:hypothetical protein